MLDLASAASVIRVMRARRLDAIRRRLLDSGDTATPEGFLAGDPGVEEIARSRPRNEDNHPTRSSHAVTTGGDRFDAQLRHQRRPSARPARVHADTDGA